MNHGALDHPLESGCRLCVFAPVADQVVEFLIDVIAQILPQKLEIDRTGAQHGRGVAVFRKAQKKMLEGCVFVVTLIGDGKGAVKGLFEIT